MKLGKKTPVKVHIYGMKYAESIRASRVDKEKDSSQVTDVIYRIKHTNGNRPDI